MIFNTFSYFIKNEKEESCDIDHYQYHADCFYEEKIHWFDGNIFVPGIDCLCKNTGAGTGGTEE